LIQTIGIALVIASAVLAWVFVIAYHLSARWWESEAGRHVMTLTAVIAVVTSLWSVGALLAPTRGDWWDVVRLVAFTGVPICLGWRLWMLYRLQIRPGLRRDRKRERP
jgi:hypothetical protein